MAFVSPQSKGDHSCNDNETESFIGREETYDDDDDGDDDDMDEEEEYNDDDDDHSNDSDNDSSESSWKDDWKQHAMAVLVAVLATVCTTGYQYYHGHQQETVQHDYYEYTSPLYGSHVVGHRHEHLDGYSRTANISFCPQQEPQQQLLQQQLQQQLRVMDFYVPLKSLNVFKLHYVADMMEDDDYSRTLNKSHEQQVPSDRVLQTWNPDYHCLLLQEQERKTSTTTTSSSNAAAAAAAAAAALDETISSKSYIVGTTYYYQPPTYLEMFPQVAQDYHDKKAQQQEQQPTTATESSSSNKTDKIDASLPTPRKRNKNNHNQPQPATLSFTGFAAKFINLSPNPVLLHWDGKGGQHSSQQLVGRLEPFESLGTATTPGQSFSVSPLWDQSLALQRWIVTIDDAVLVYKDTSKKGSSMETTTDQWTIQEQQLYHMQLINLEFAKHYMIASRRTWLAHFPRPFPVHPLLPADYVGQTYNAAAANDADSDDNDNVLKKRTVKVLSVTPRVLEIENFLTKQECFHLIQMAQSRGMHGSTLYTGGGTGIEEATATATTMIASDNNVQQQLYGRRDTATRSSTNTWLERDTNYTTDQIYRRAAKLLNMNESLLQQQQHAHFDDQHYAEEDQYDATRHSMAESLQVVRYEPGQEYTAHHDFVYPSIRHRYQPTRYATLLLYLNDDYDGGETNFPRAINPTNHDGITVTPRQGKAVLFYNILPDGNVDDLSQHRSLPVTKGEKWLANLWIWDPVIN